MGGMSVFGERVFDIASVVLHYGIVRYGIDKAWLRRGVS